MVMRNAVMRCGKFGRLASHVGEIGDFWTRICQEVCLDAAKGLWDSPSSGEYVRRRTPVTLPGLVQCHGARYGQGPILAMLAVLGRKTPSAWLRFSPDLRCAPCLSDGVGTEGVPPFQPFASGAGRTKG